MFNTPQTITLGGTQLELSDTTGTETITGPAAGVTVSGDGASRVFQVDSGCHGVDLGTDDHRRQRGQRQRRRPVQHGTTTLTNCTVSGNSASYGGGVFDNTGTLTLTNCTVSGNSAGNGGGGVSSGLRSRWQHDHADQLHRQRQLRQLRPAACTTGTMARPR